MLKKTTFLIKKKLPINIAYFGGSITEGAGVEDVENCWRRKITKWFKDNFCDSEITEINAAIGGTGSNLGIFRCDKEVIDLEPDLVFVEFAVNDGMRESSIDDMDTIVRKILNYNPTTDIVFIFTVTKDHSEMMRSGQFVESREAQKKLAAYYGIDIIDVGCEIETRVINNDGDWKTYTIDNCHPNERGYELYTNRIIKYLKENLKLPSPVGKRILENAYMSDAYLCETTDFTKSEKDMCKRWPHVIEADEKGKYIEFKFSGSCIGIYHAIYSDSGDLMWSVDDSEKKRYSTWDKYALQFDRAGYTVFTNKLDEGNHTLRIEVLGEHNEQSKGNFIRIAAFLVG